MARRTSRRRRPTTRQRRNEFLRSPFNPTQQPYQTWRDFERDVRETAGREYQPLLQDVSRERTREQNLNRGRGADIVNQSRAYEQALTDAFNRTQSALNNVLTTSGAQSNEASNILGAALNSTVRQGQDVASRIGAPADSGAAVASAVENASREAARGQQALAGTAGTLIGDVGARTALAGTSRRGYEEQESRRYQSALQELSGRERDIRSNIPGVIAQVRERLLERARAAQNQGFQQNLAQQEFGLQRENTEFQQGLATSELGLREREQSHREAIDFAQLDLAAQELQAQIEAAAEGGTEAEREEAKLRGEQVANAREWLESFTTPAEGEVRTQNRSDRRRFNRKPADAYRVLTQRYNLSRREALRLIHSVPDRRWETFSTRKPRRRRGGAGGGGGAIGIEVGQGG